MPGDKILVFQIVIRINPTTRPANSAAANPSTRQNFPGCPPLERFR
jgi:hypothetical protein